MPFAFGLLADLVFQFHFFQTAQFLTPCLLQEVNHRRLPYASCWAALLSNEIESLTRKVTPFHSALKLDCPSLPPWNHEIANMNEMENTMTAQRQ